MKNIFITAALITATVVASTNLAHAQDQPHRKLSDQGRGAIIGGAGGAVAGGIIGHGVGGALIGGAIGAGGGYVIGNEHRRNVARKHAAYLRAQRHRRYHHTYAKTN